MNEAERILSAAGDAGAVIVLVLSAVFIVWMLKSAFIEAMRLWRDAAKERNAIDEKRNEIDEKVANTLVSVTSTLERLQADAHDTNTLVTGLRRAQTDHNAGAIERHGAVMDALHPIHTVVQYNGSAIEQAQTALMERLNQHGNQIDKLLKKLEVAVFPVSVRGDITRLIELITTVSADVKAFKPITDDITEAASKATNAATKTGQHPPNADPPEDPKPNQEA